MYFDFIQTKSLAKSEAKSVRVMLFHTKLKNSLRKKNEMYTSIKIIKGLLSHCGFNTGKITREWIGNIQWLWLKLWPRA